MGRNCLLGSLADSVFTCVSSLSDQEAVVCTDGGSICLLDDTEGNQKLTQLVNQGFSITSIVCNRETREVWLGDSSGRIRHFKLGELMSMSPDRTTQGESENALPSPARTSKMGGIVGLGLIEGRLISLDSARAISIRKSDELNHGGDSTLQAHNEPILGIGVLTDRSRSHRGADFFTWSSGGQVNFWGLSGNFLDSMLVSVEQVSTTVDEVCNELKVLRVSEDMSFFVSGDRYGVVK